MSQPKANHHRITPKANSTTHTNRKGKMTLKLSYLLAFLGKGAGFEQGGIVLN